MKTTRITAFAAVGAAAVLSLTACDNGDSGKDSSSPPAASSSSSSSSSDGTAKAGSGSGTGASQQAGDAKAGSGVSAAAAGAGKSAANAANRSTFCRTKDLTVVATNAAPDAVSGRIDITMTNWGSTACSATGFPGVDITDADHTSSPVERGRAEPRITILEPGDSAVFDLAYDIDSTGHAATSPTALVVTPPNETQSVTLKWPADAKPVKGSYVGVRVYPTHTTE